jgi:hypothetical protein
MTMEKIKEKLGNLPIPDAKEMIEIEKAMKQIAPYIEKLSLLLEFVPKFDVQRIKLGGKSYVAILFERTPKPEPPKEEAKQP